MWKRILIVTVVVVCLFLVIAFVRFGRPGAVRVPSGSMANTIIPGDQILTTSRIGTIHRGDLIIFKYPNDSNTHYLSRVIGLAGESIQIVANQVLINGKPLEERRVKVKVSGNILPMKEIGAEGNGPYTVYYDSDMTPELTLTKGETFAVQGPYTVPGDACFVMGDNRDNSMDSRFKGPVPLANISARPELVYSNDSGDTSRFFKRLK